MPAIRQTHTEAGMAAMLYLPYRFEVRSLLWGL
jgi:hypothetical protein